MKQTAVEWLIEQISSSKYFYKLIEDINSRSTIEQCNIFEQAKAMHKSEIIWAHGIKMKGVNNHKCVSGEQYYKETFKKD